MENYIDICEGKAVIVTDSENALDIRKLDMGKKVLITIVYDKEYKK